MAHNIIDLPAETIVDLEIKSMDWIHTDKNGKRSAATCTTGPLIDMVSGWHLWIVDGASVKFECWRRNVDPTDDLIVELKLKYDSELFVDRHGRFTIKMQSYGRVMRTTPAAIVIDMEGKIV